MNGCIRSELEQFLQSLRVSSGGNHAARAQQSCNLYGQLSCNACGAKDEHGLVFCDLCALAEYQPSRYSWVGERRGRRVIQTIRNGKTKRCGRYGTLRHGAKGTARPAKKDPGSVGEIADTVRAANYGKFARTGEVRAAGELLVHGFQRGRTNSDDNFILPRCGFCKLFVPGRLPQFM